MIEAIVGELYLFDEIDLSTYYDLANAVLSVVEKNGMKPPLNDQEYHHMDNDDRVTVNACKPFYTWESE